MQENNFSSITIIFSLKFLYKEECEVLYKGIQEVFEQFKDYDTELYGDLEKGEKYGIRAFRWKFYQRILRESESPYFNRMIIEFDQAVLFGENFDICISLMNRFLGIMNVRPCIEYIDCRYRVCHHDSYEDSLDVINEKIKRIKDEIMKYEYNADNPLVINQGFFSDYIINAPCFAQILEKFYSYLKTENNFYMLKKNCILALENSNKINVNDEMFDKLFVEIVKLIDFDLMGLNQHNEELKEYTQGFWEARHKKMSDTVYWLESKGFICLSSRELEYWAETLGCIARRNKELIDKDDVKFCIIYEILEVYLSQLSKIIEDEKRHRTFPKESPFGVGCYSKE